MPTSLIEFLNENPELEMVWYVLAAYLLAYAAVYILGRLRVSRARSSVDLDHAVYSTIFWVFVIHAAVPTYCLIDLLVLGLLGDWSPTWYHVAIFWSFVLIDVLIIVIAIARVRERGGREARSAA